MSVRAESEVFRQIPLFANCDPAHLQVIAFSSDKLEFASGDTILRQGKKGEAGFLILRGTAEVQAAGPQGTETIATLEPGAFVGELGMIAAVPYAVSVIATGKVSAARVSRELFMRVASEFPDFGARVHATLAAKLEGTVADLRSVKSKFDQAATFARR